MRMLRAHPEFFASSLSPLTSHAAVESVFPLSSLGSRGRAVNSTTARSGSSRCPTATRPSCAACGGSSGDSSKTSEASSNTSAAMTSDLRLPEIAPRSLAACRVPTRDRSQPARCSPTCKPNQVIDVGSATATTGPRGESVLRERDSNVGTRRTPRNCSARETRWSRLGSDSWMALSTGVSCRRSVGFGLRTRARSSPGRNHP